MDTVKVKTKNPLYDGHVRGHKFHRGQAEMSRKDAEALTYLGIEIEVIENVAAITESPKAKRSVRVKKGE